MQPQIPRKGTKSARVVTKANKAKVKLPIIARNQSMKYESNQHLADLEVECSNKDNTIQEQEKDIEEMKENVRKLQVELEDLCKKQIETEEQHTKDIETMVNIFLNRSYSRYRRRVSSRCFVVFLIIFLLTCRPNCNKKY